MAIATASSFSFAHHGSVNNHLCMVDGVSNSWMKTTFDGCRISDFSGMRCKKKINWLSQGHELCPSKVWVAADYSDSVPDSPNYINNKGYHPLEEVKVGQQVRKTKLTTAEEARTTVEANSTALVVFPGIVHSEPHEHKTWAEFQYFVDDYGDIFFEIFDDDNIMEDPRASNPVTALIGMDISIYKYKRLIGGFNTLDMDSGDEIPFDDDYFEDLHTDLYVGSEDWGMPKGSHPVHFAKFLTKAVQIEYDKKMNNPSNGVSIIGCLRPAFPDETVYLRRLLDLDESDEYSSDNEDEFLSSSVRIDGKCRSHLYRLEIMRMDLFSVYGVQSLVSLNEFQDAEPDILVHNTKSIMEQFEDKEIRYDIALKALCKKRGIQAEAASLIGVDSLGIDVRIFSGLEVKTHRFPFKNQAMSGSAAKKQIQQLLFPRSRRKRFRTTHGDGLRNTCSS